jgi:hypothetical protein
MVNIFIINNLPFPKLWKYKFYNMAHNYNLVKYLKKIYNEIYNN